MLLMLQRCDIVKTLYSFIRVVWTNAVFFNTFGTMHKYKNVSGRNAGMVLVNIFFQNALFNKKLTKFDNYLSLQA